VSFVLAVSIGAEEVLLAVAQAGVGLIAAAGLTA